MSDIQLKSPNLSIVGSEGLCLVYVREVFGVAAKYPTAITAWDDATYKHAGETPPSDIAVPVWFSYSGPDGHVAVWANGTIHSTSAKGMQTFDSIQALINWMGESFEYLGYSEDLNGVRVAEIVATPPPAPAPAPAPAATPATAESNYTVVTNIKGYTDSNDAANHTGIVVMMDPGNYFVFNEAHGMINITTVEGKPGAWINPADNQVTNIAPTPSVPVSEVVPAPAPASTTPEATTSSADDFPVTVPATPAITASEGSVPVTVNPSTPTSWQNTYTAFLSPQDYIANTTVTVHDINGVHADVTLNKGTVKSIAGTFTKDNVEYYLTENSVDADPRNWLGIPVISMTKVSTSDDELEKIFDDIENEGKKIASATNTDGFLNKLFRKNKGVTK